MTERETIERLLAQTWESDRAFGEACYRAALEMVARRLEGLHDFIPGYEAQRRVLAESAAIRALAGEEERDGD